MKQAAEGPLPARLVEEHMSQDLPTWPKTVQALALSHPCDELSLFSNVFRHLRDASAQVPGALNDLQIGNWQRLVIEWRSGERLLAAGIANAKISYQEPVAPARSSPWYIPQRQALLFINFSSKGNSSPYAHSGGR